MVKNIYFLKLVFKYVKVLFCIQFYNAMIGETVSF